MSTRLIRKLTGLTYEPPDAPGIVVEYTLHPEQTGKPATRDSEGQEYIPARVEVETVTCRNLTEDLRNLLAFTRATIDGFLKPSFRVDELRLGDLIMIAARIDAALSAKPVNLLPWLQLHGADEDEVCEKLAEGILGNHR